MKVRKLFLFLFVFVAVASVLLITYFIGKNQSSTIVDPQSSANAIDSYRSAGFVAGQTLTCSPGLTENFIYDNVVATQGANAYLQTKYTVLGNANGNISILPGNTSAIPSDSWLNYDVPINNPDASNLMLVTNDKFSGDFVLESASFSSFLNIANLNNSSPLSMSIGITDGLGVAFYVEIKPTVNGQGTTSLKLIGPNGSNGTAVLGSTTFPSTYIGLQFKKTGSTIKVSYGSTTAGYTQLYSGAIVSTNPFQIITTATAATGVTAIQQNATRYANHRIDWIKLNCSGTPPTTSTGHMPVYRFWSDRYRKHFYTISADEKANIEATMSNVWRYERIAFYAVNVGAGGTCPAGLSPVYRFWSNRYTGHFYTISASERDDVINGFDDNTWLYERPAYCAAATQIAQTVPLFRFWSSRYNGHFYTNSTGERDNLINTASNIWRYEREAYYVYSN